MRFPGASGLWTTVLLMRCPLGRLFHLNVVMVSRYRSDVDLRASALGLSKQVTVYLVAGARVSCGRHMTVSFPPSFLAEGGWFGS